MVLNNYCTKNLSNSYNLITIELTLKSIKMLINYVSSSMFHIFYKFTTKCNTLRQQYLSSFSLCLIIMIALAFVLIIWRWWKSWFWHWKLRLDLDEWLEYYTFLFCLFLFLLYWLLVIFLLNILFDLAS